MAARPATVGGGAGRSSAKRSDDGFGSLKSMLKDSNGKLRFLSNQTLDSPLRLSADIPRATVSDDELLRDTKSKTLEDAEAKIDAEVEAAKAKVKALRSAGGIAGTTESQLLIASGFINDTKQSAAITNALPGSAGAIGNEANIFGAKNSAALGLTFATNSSKRINKALGKVGFEPPLPSLDVSGAVRVYEPRLPPVLDESTRLRRPLGSMEFVRTESLAVRPQTAGATGATPRGGVCGLPRTASKARLTGSGAASGTAAGRPPSTSRGPAAVTGTTVPMPEPRSEPIRPPLLRQAVVYDSGKILPPAGRGDDEDEDGAGGNGAAEGKDGEGKEGEGKEADGTGDKNRGPALRPPSAPRLPLRSGQILVDGRHRELGRIQAEGTNNIQIGPQGAVVPPLKDYIPGYTEASGLGLGMSKSSGLFGALGGGGNAGGAGAGGLMGALAQAKAGKTGLAAALGAGAGATAAPVLHTGVAHDIVPSAGGAQTGQPTPATTTHGNSSTSTAHGGTAIPATSSRNLPFDATLTERVITMAHLPKVLSVGHVATHPNVMFRVSSGAHHGSHSSKDDNGGNGGGGSDDAALDEDVNADAVATRVAYSSSGLAMPVPYNPGGGLAALGADLIRNAQEAAAEVPGPAHPISKRLAAEFTYVEAQLQDRHALPSAVLRPGLTALRPPHLLELGKLPAYAVEAHERLDGGFGPAQGPGQGRASGGQGRPASAAAMSISGRPRSAAPVAAAAVASHSAATAAGGSGGVGGSGIPVPRLQIPRPTSPMAITGGAAGALTGTMAYGHGHGPLTSTLARAGSFYAGSTAGPLTSTMMGRGGPMTSTAAGGPLASPMAGTGGPLASPVARAGAMGMASPAAAMGAATPGGPLGTARGSISGGPLASPRPGSPTPKPTGLTIHTPAVPPAGSSNSGTGRGGPTGRPSTSPGGVSPTPRPQSPAMKAKIEAARKDNPWELKPSVLASAKPMSTGVTTAGEIKVGPLRLDAVQTHALSFLQKHDPAVATVFAALVRHGDVEEARIRQATDAFNETSAAEKERLQAALQQYEHKITSRRGHKFNGLENIMTLHGGRAEALAAMKGWGKGAVLEQDAVSAVAGKSFAANASSVAGTAGGPRLTSQPGYGHGIAMSPMRPGTAPGQYGSGMGMGMGMGSSMADLPPPVEDEEDAAARAAARRRARLFNTKPVDDLTGPRASLVVNMSPVPEALAAIRVTTAREALLDLHDCHCVVADCLRILAGTRPAGMDSIDKCLVGLLRTAVATDAVIDAPWLRRALGRLHASIMSLQDEALPVELTGDPFRGFGLAPKHMYQFQTAAAKANTSSAKDTLARQASFKVDVTFGKPSNESAAILEASGWTVAVGDPDLDPTAAAALEPTAPIAPPLLTDRERVARTARRCWPLFLGESLHQLIAFTRLSEQEYEAWLSERGLAMPTWGAYRLVRQWHKEEAGKLEKEANDRNRRASLSM